MASLAAKSTSMRTTGTCSAARRTTRAVRVVAQAQPLRAPEAQQQQQQGAAPRAVHVSASASASLHHGPTESVWFEDLARFFNLAPSPSQEDEEWRQIFGQYLEEDDKAHRSHGMFVSHLAERMALEPPQRR